MPLRQAMRLFLIDSSAPLENPYALLPTRMLAEAAPRDTGSGTFDQVLRNPEGLIRSVCFESRRETHRVLLKYAGQGIRPSAPSL